MQTEEDVFIQIINDSKKKLLDLKLLSNFFKHPLLISIVIRTKIIHTFFEKNKSLDTNKLDLFHLQYTDTLIELLHKLKKSKEQEYLLIVDEISINSEFISKIDFEIQFESFSENFKSHSELMSKQLEQLYNILLVDNKKTISWNNIIKFSSEFKTEFYRQIPIEQYEELVCFERQTYDGTNAIIEKKLLGRLNILKFKVKFLCGLVCKNEVIEVFEFRDSNDLFIFIASNKSFFFLGKNDRKDIDLSKNSSNRSRIVDDLKNKNNFLNQRLDTVKTDLRLDVQVILKEYLDKISSAIFLDELQNIDEQTNTLKAMLNINFK